MGSAQLSGYGFAPDDPLQPKQLMLGLALCVPLEQMCR